MIGKAGSLVVDNVSYSVDGKNIVKDVSLQALAGECTLLIGHSGAGKSTLVALAGALLPVSEGTVSLGGIDISSLTQSESSEFRKKVGFIFQDPMLLDELTVLDNISWVARLRGLSRSKAVEDSRHALGQVGLGMGMAKRSPAYLSGGERQRVAIARSIVGRPHMLIADEPTSALDSTNSRVVGELLLELARQLQIPLVIASHDDMFRRYSHGIVELKDGRIVWASR